jgi:DNA-directed RNA polymerase beta subunit
MTVTILTVWYHLTAIQEVTVLTKFKKTNQSTTINLKPIVKKGQRVEKGQVLCEGYATQNGELALGP